jgi:hypothetical protein
VKIVSAHRHAVVDVGVARGPDRPPRANVRAPRSGLRRAAPSATGRARDAVLTRLGNVSTSCWKTMRPSPYSVKVGAWLAAKSIDSRRSSIRRDDVGRACRVVEPESVGLGGSARARRGAEAAAAVQAPVTSEGDGARGSLIFDMPPGTPRAPGWFRLDRCSSTPAAAGPADACETRICESRARFSPEVRISNAPTLDSTSILPVMSLGSGTEDRGPRTALLSARATSPSRSGGRGRPSRRRNRRLGRGCTRTAR